MPSQEYSTSRKITIRFPFGEKELLVKREKYPNGNIALVAYDGDGEYATLSVNTEMLLGEDGDDLVAVKNYSENEGVAVSLYANGIISEPLFWLPIGLTRVPICICFL